MTPTSRDLQEMNGPVQPSYDVQPLSLSPYKLVIEQEWDLEMWNLKGGTLSKREAEKIPTIMLFFLTVAMCL